jgi:altronate hydrolase
MCVSETADQVVRYLESSKDVEHKYPNVDGIVAISNTEGCGCAANEQIERFLGVLKGYIRHPNVGGCLIMDLGCEQTNYEKMFSCLSDTVAENLKPIDWITVQESGGTRLAIDKAVNIISHRLAEVNNITRKPSPISELVIGTECGASDSFSGITANPVIGNAVDRIILGKGSGILSEIPEMLGTYEMLLPRFRTSEIAERFNRLIEWYINIAKKLDLTLNDNLVPENIEGGLLNNYIKSIGAVMKGGSTVIEDVLEYAEPVREKGLSIMQGPGGDLESVTGIVASGATVICFSTGKGTTTGNAICPVIKISSNNSTFNKLPEDIDFNAGSLLTEQTTINKLGAELLEIIIDVASGKETWSERWKQRQFQVWIAGKLSL